MSNIELFNFEGNEVRTVIMNDDIWFVGKDVCNILGYSNPRKALASHVFDDDKGVTIRDSIGREQNPTMINESGLYALIFGSRLDSAKRFKHWVTSEVLPSVSTYGCIILEGRYY